VIANIFTSVIIYVITKLFKEKKTFAEVVLRLTRLYMSVQSKKKLENGNDIIISFDAKGSFCTR